MARLAPAAATAVMVLAAVVSVAAGLQAINVTSISFEEGYAPLFGHDNILRSADDRTVSLLLDRTTGSGFISSAMYQHGLFSASIKLPSDYTAGVVVAFYTNVYGNGSVSRGREERYVLPFDPTTEFHRYSILWTPSSVAFYVDDVPVREVRRSPAMGGDFPSKPMSLYATVWDASNWATSGGKYKVNYRYGPFVASFTDLALAGCRVAQPGIRMMTMMPPDRRGY
ncbi:hypothetical protein PR202_gb01597 [Eleusine coracana subsp. coracana]|uniref:GH16 domain-containing protein n=1 Tax=Eleusine coracana subsp. coracana TaxID=191504 RepID=A0AAV5DWY3_ELECO|nr:hypothetical protein PR202_gb01597 [Eleusine coracana subsp. coracana]